MIHMEHRLATRATRRGAVAALAAATLLGVAACGSDSGSDSGGSGPTTASTAIPAALASYFPGKAASGDPVKIGLLNTEGGPALSDPEIGDAAVAAAEYANAHLGGIAGHPIEIDRCGILEDVASSVKCANQMVEDKVAAVVVTTTGFGESIVPIITKAGIPYVSVAGASSGEFTSKNAFMWTGGFAATLSAMATYSAEQGYKKVAAFVTDVPAATGGAAKIGVPAFKAAGVEFTVVPVTPGTADATPQVTSGLAGKPDAAILIFNSTGCTTALQALSVVNPTIPKLGITGCLDPATVDAVGDAIEGAKIFGVSSVETDDPEAQLYRTVMAKYAPKASISGYTPVGYQGMLGLIRATADLTGSVTSGSILAALAQAKDVPLPAGTGITFTCDGKQLPGLTTVCSAGEIVLTVKDGKGTQPETVDN
ncbi:ABC transporter substrate-binding protein [Parafrankia discariae]|uniref:ABC transporter substrate-binding protein n=1 Tax=Parafrankia discariae TaxID=365528 RepID=UPI000371E6E2